MKQRNCVACGTEFTVNTRGRPRKWCDDCRAAEPRQQPIIGATRSCEHCGSPYIVKPLGQHGRYCQESCRRAAQKQRTINDYPQPALCAWCGDLFDQQRAVHRVCSIDCSRRKYRFDNPDKHAYSESKRSADQRRRARKKQAFIGPRFTALQVYQRDHWTCQICNSTIDPNLQFPHPKSGSVDHIIPLSKGGDHSMTNVQATHFSCNLAKRDTIPPLGEGVRAATTATGEDCFRARQDGIRTT